MHLQQCASPFSSLKSSSGLLLHWPLLSHCLSQFVLLSQQHPITHAHKSAGDVNHAANWPQHTTAGTPQAVIHIVLMRAHEHCLKPINHLQSRACPDNPQTSCTAPMAGIFSRSFCVTATRTVITFAAGPVILICRAVENVKRHVRIGHAVITWARKLRLQHSEVCSGHQAGHGQSSAA